MDAIRIAKLAARLVVGISAAAVTRAIIKETLTEPETTIEKIKVAAGVWAIAGVVSEVCKAHTDSKIDEAVGLYKKHIAPMIKPAK